jgi:hypothetical protein
MTSSSEGSPPPVQLDRETLVDLLATLDRLQRVLIFDAAEHRAASIATLSGNKDRADGGERGQS